MHNSVIASQFASLYAIADGETLQKMDKKLFVQCNSSDLEVKLFLHSLHFAMLYCTTRQVSN